jgi:hypothetical protein
MSKIANPGLRVKVYDPLPAVTEKLRPLTIHGPEHKTVEFKFLVILYRRFEMSLAS